MGFIDESILINNMSKSTKPAIPTHKHAITMSHTCNGDHQTCRHGVEYYMCASVFAECDGLQVFQSHYCVYNVCVCMSVL